MTSSAYGLAREIRLLTAAGWPVASVIARAEAGLAWAAFIRELADGNGRRAFEHAEAARRCDNCGYACDYEARPPRRQLGMMSFVDAGGPLHYCAVRSHRRRSSGRDHRRNRKVSGHRRAQNGPISALESRRNNLRPQRRQTGTGTVQALKSAKDAETDATKGTKPRQEVAHSQPRRRRNGRGTPTVAPHVQERSRGQRWRERTTATRHLCKCPYPVWNPHRPPSPRHPSRSEPWQQHALASAGVRHSTQWNDSGSLMAP